MTKWSPSTLNVVVSKTIAMQRSVQPPYHHYHKWFTPPPFIARAIGPPYVREEEVFFILHVHYHPFMSTTSPPLSELAVGWRLLVVGCELDVSWFGWKENKDDLFLFISLFFICFFALLLFAVIAVLLIACFLIVVLLLSYFCFTASCCCLIAALLLSYCCLIAVLLLSYCCVSAFFCCLCFLCTCCHCFVYYCCLAVIVIIVLFGNIE